MWFPLWKQFEHTPSHFLCCFYESLLCSLYISPAHMCTLIQSSCRDLETPISSVSPLLILFSSLFLSAGFTWAFALYFGLHLFPLHLNVSPLRCIASCRCAETWNGIIPPPSAPSTQKQPQLWRGPAVNPLSLFGDSGWSFRGAGRRDRTTRRCRHKTSSVCVCEWVCNCLRVCTIKSLSMSLRVCDGELCILACLSVDKTRMWI